MAALPFSSPVKINVFYDSRDLRRRCKMPGCCPKGTARRESKRTGKLSTLQRFGPHAHNNWHVNSNNDFHDRLSWFTIQHARIAPPIFSPQMVAETRAFDFSLAERIPRERTSQVFDKTAGGVSVVAAD